MARKPSSSRCLLAVTMSVGCERRVVSAPPLPAPTVEVASVIQKDVPIEGEWIGTLDGYVNAHIQPHVTGYLIRLDYQEGGFVRQGQMLFEIDPRPFQAASGSPRTSRRPQCSWPLTRQVG